MSQIGLCEGRILFKEGGHIGDGIRPSERRKGYGTEMIRRELLVYRYKKPGKRGKLMEKRLKEKSSIELKLRRER